MKRILISFINGFCYSIGITAAVQTAVIFLTGEFTMLAEYQDRFSDPVTAFALQLILIGIMSGLTSAGTAVFEARKIGLLTQSLIFLVIMLAVWIPVSCYVWGFYKYTASMIATISSMIVTYGICWGIMYKLCKRDIDSINAKLSEKEGNES